MEENTPKEVNLLDLLSVFFNWVKRMFLGALSGLGFLVKLTYRKFWVFMILGVLAIAASFYLTRPAARIYKAEGTLMLFGPDAKSVKEYATQLENLSKNSTTLSFTKTLHLPDSVAQNLVEIKTFYVIDYNKDSIPDVVDYKNNHSLSDTVNVVMNDRLCVRIKTKKINQVGQIDAAITDYFNSNNSFKEQYLVAKSQYVNQLNATTLELKRLDSLANTTYFKDAHQQIKLSDNRLIVGEQYKQLFYADVLKLEKLKTEAEKAIAKYHAPAQCPNGLIVSLNPVNNLPLYLIITLAVAYLLGILLALLIENHSAIRKYLNGK